MRNFYFLLCILSVFPVFLKTLSPCLSNVVAFVSIDALEYVAEQINSGI